MTTQSLPYAHLGEALATDYFQVREQFTDEQWEHFLTTRRFVDEEVLPAINEYWEAAELPWPLMRRLADLGLYGEDIAGYGCPGMSPLARGLVNMELHRGDGSLGTFLGVQSGLAMKSIDLLGSEEQKERWLPALARLDAIGAFALTEPDARLGLGRARDDRAPRRRRLGARRRQALDRQRLDRRRRRRLGALRRGRPGQGLPRRDRHAGLRRRRRSPARAPRARSGRREIRLDGVRVPERRGCRGRETRSRTPAACSSRRARRARGARSATRSPRTTRRSPTARSARSSASRCAASRSSRSGSSRCSPRSPACSSTACSSPAWRRTGRLTDTIAGLAKFNNTRKAREVIAEARDMLGGNGVLLENHVIRHMGDIEVIHTYEGTATMQALIVGRDITGVGAFV